MIDYIETRKDLDHEKLAYYGVDTGAYLGNILGAIEKRIKVLLLAGGGFYLGKKGKKPVEGHYSGGST